ncbi:MAG TPA: FliH/SctL family protein [Kineosporiaceae bacterium]
MPLSNERFSTLPVEQRTPVVTSGEAANAARAVNFDRPLVEQPGWADPRIGRQIAEALRAGRQQGLAEGYAAGWAQGRREAAEREAAEAAERAAREEATRRVLAVRTQGALAALARAARTLADDVAPAWSGLVDALLEGSLAIAAAALGRELAAVDADVLEAARTALRLLPHTDTVTLHVHPADVDLFEACDAGPLDGVQVVPDDTVERGAVLARTPVHALPVHLRDALRAAQEVLRP